MLGSKVAHLVGLVVDYVACVRDVLIYELLVLNIDEWSKEDDAVGDQSETPERHPLDEPVAEE